MSTLDLIAALAKQVQRVNPMQLDKAGQRQWHDMQEWYDIFEKEAA